MRLHLFDYYNDNSAFVWLRIVYKDPEHQSISYYSFKNNFWGSGDSITLADANAIRTENK